MRANIITVEQLRTSNGRNYNPTLWDERIDKMSKYSNVLFYHVPKGDGYDYDRYYCEYTLPEGLRLLAPFGYGGSLSNGGFFRAQITKVTAEGLTLHDAINAHIQGDKKRFHKIWEEVESSDLVELSAEYMYDSNGNKALYGNSPEARREMIKKSKEYGVAYTKGL